LTAFVETDRETLLPVIVGGKILTEGEDFYRSVDLDILFIPGNLARCVEWHDVATFGWREPPPIGCGFPYDIEPEIRPSRRGKSPQKARLTISPAPLKFSQIACFKVRP
jgi:hypothetical protein